MYGFGSILLGTTLASQGFEAAEVGVVFTAMLVGMAASSIGVGLRGDRVGRRRLYFTLLLVMGLAGTAFAFRSPLWLLILAALTGTLSTDPNESGPITTLEQAMIGGASPETRARVFGRYNAVAFVAGSVGSLAAGGPAAFREVISGVPSDQRFLLVFPAMGLVAALFSQRLSPALDAPTGGNLPPRRGLARSRSTVARLSALFALDAGAGGFVVQAFVAFWFNRRFGASPELMGVVFFGAGILQAASSIVAGRLASKIGLLNTMVFTHLPSNLLLAAVAFAPTLEIAVVLLLGRFVTSQMDVPARQAYVVSMVDPEERTAAAAFTNMARYVSRPIGPAAAGGLMQQGFLAAPFVIAGGLKIVYDLALYVTFRRVKLPEGRKAD